MTAKAKKIGTIIHYYDKIKVAVVKLSSGDLKIGDNVKLTKKDGSGFTQTVSSMQIEHASIDIAQKGDEFGLKVTSDVKDHSEVAKV